uniref:Putative secreted protein n=1 Tax=Rhipicephalus microplus TaxID=6941 RepID=A0A6G5A2X2_RHIMP
MIWLNLFLVISLLSHYTFQFVLYCIKVNVTLHRICVFEEVVSFTNLQSWARNWVKWNEPAKISLEHSYSTWHISYTLRWLNISISTFQF